MMKSILIVLLLAGVAEAGTHIMQNDSITVSSITLVDGSSITTTSSSSSSRITLNLPNSLSGGVRINGGGSGAGVNEYVDISPTHLTLDQQVVGPASFPHLDFCNTGTCQSIYGDPTYSSPANGLYFLGVPSSGNPPLFVGASSVTVNAVGGLNVDSGTLSVPTPGGVNITYGIVAATATFSSLTLSSKALATLQALTPINVGEGYYCSDCSTALLCISTGTGKGAFVSEQASNRTTACN